jgi:hypothetical protein
VRSIVKKLFALRSRNTGRPSLLESGGNMGGFAGAVQFAAAAPVDKAGTPVLALFLIKGA